MTSGAHIFRVLSVLTLAIGVLPLAFAAEPGPAGRAKAEPKPDSAQTMPGFEKEPMRLLYCEDAAIAPAEFQRIREAGFNPASIIHWKVYEPAKGEAARATIANARQAGLKVLVTFWPGTALATPDFAAEHPFEFSNGAQPSDAQPGHTYGPDRITRPVDIYDAEYWDKQLIPRCLDCVRMSNEGTVIGCAFDLELYHNPPVPAVYEDVCFCDRCLAALARECKGQAPTTMPAGKRPEALAATGRLEEYRAWQGRRLDSCIRRLRDQTDAINPRFFYALAPYTRKGNFFNRALAKELGTERAPVLLLTEGTYSPTANANPAQDLVAKADYLADLLRREALDGHHSVLLPGFSVIAHSAKTMANRIAFFGQSPPGYWVWGREWIARSKFAKPADLWEAFKIGNRAAAESATRPSAGGPGSMPKVEAGPNLITNGSFADADLSKTWKLSEGARLVATSAPDGKHGVQLTATKEVHRPTATPRPPDGAAGLPVEAGRAYRLSFWNRTTRYVEGYNAYAEFRWLGPDGKEIGPAQEIGTGSNIHDWVLSSGVVVAPPKATGLRLQLAVLGTGIVCEVGQVALQPLVVQAEP